ncbi:MAG: hypothetical protein WDM96_06660 [Lacunisphaera sp.]
MKLEHPYPGRISRTPSPRWPSRRVTDSRRVYLYGTRFGGVLAVEIATRSNRFAAIATVNIPANVIATTSSTTPTTTGSTA